MTTNDQRLRIVQIIADAGFAAEGPEVFATAVAIALRESGLNPDAYNGNVNTGDKSYGLFQLNTLGGLWKRFQQMGFTDPNQLRDPAANARAAYALYKQSGFYPWLGYRPGLTVAKQLPTARALIQQAGVTTGAGGVGARTGLGGPGRSVSFGAPALSGSGSLSDTVRELYGYLAMYLDDPELGPILTQAAEENWSSSRLQGAIEQTDWWNNTAASVRQWDANEAEDPATARATIEQRMADVQAQANSAGFTIASDHLYDLARDSLRLGWSQQQLVNAIGAEAVRNGSLSTSRTMQDVRAQAEAYAVPMSDAALQQWGTDIASGRTTAEAYREYLVGVAKGAYPGLAEQLDRGSTVKQLADPYVQVAAQTLGIGPDSIDLRDPKWIAALNARDPKTGAPRALTIDEWGRKLRSDPVYGWQNTSDARAQAFAFAAKLGTTFGSYQGT